MKTPTDTEIIDWLEKQGNAHRKWCVQLPTDYPHVAGCVFVCKNSSCGFDSIRSAVAAKMGKEH